MFVPHIIVPSFNIFSHPKKYIEEKHSEEKLTSIEYAIICKVSFHELYDYSDYEICGNTIRIQNKYIKPESYGFITKIKFDGDEYEELKKIYKSDFDNFLIETAKNKSEYSNALNEILSKQDSNRKYDIDHWIEDFPNTTYSHREWTEYRAVY